MPFRPHRIPDRDGAPASEYRREIRQLADSIQAQLSEQSGICRAAFNNFFKLPQLFFQTVWIFSPACYIPVEMRAFALVQHGSANGRKLRRAFVVACREGET